MKMFLDKNNNMYWAPTISALRKQIANGGSRVDKMYRDKPDGTVVHVGYVIANQWLTAYTPVELPC